MDDSLTMDETGSSLEMDADPSKSTSADEVEEPAGELHEIEAVDSIAESHEEDGEETSPSQETKKSQEDRLRKAEVRERASRASVEEIAEVEDLIGSDNFIEADPDNNEFFTENNGDEALWDFAEEESEEDDKNKDPDCDDLNDEDYEEEISKSKKKKKKKTPKKEDSGKKKRKRVEEVEDEDDADGDDEPSKKKSSHQRKNIRKIKDDTKLEETTRVAQEEEAARKKRLQELREKILQEFTAQQHNKQKHTKERAKSNLIKTALLKGTSSVSIEEKKKINPQLHSLLRPDPEVKAPVQKEVPVVKQEPVQDDSADVIELSSDSEDEMAAGAKKELDDKLEGSGSDSEVVMVGEGEEDEGDEDDDPDNSGGHVNDEFNVPDDQGRVLVNVGHPDDESDIFLSPQLANAVKPHQIGGIRFLYDNVVESIDRYKNSAGLGCILAHSMGLGKTIQLISFTDVFLRHTEAKYVMIIVPVNTLQNWVCEFSMWLPSEEELKENPTQHFPDAHGRTFGINILNDNVKNTKQRAKLIKEWRDKGGVMLIGYEMYRLLASKRSLLIKPKKAGKRKPRRDDIIDIEEEDDNKRHVEEMYEALVDPGPDLVVCDEGHRIKNSHASISQALKCIRTKRRIVLTGYPLQNNLIEYWCMVDFVRPNYLGSKAEFCNMFERPINNGQCMDSTTGDLKMMRYRAHVLHSLLEGFVQRRGHAVLMKSLPPKHEYVLMVKMSDIQRQLYKRCMEEIVWNDMDCWAHSNPLKAFSICCKIWNHPDILYQLLRDKSLNDFDLDTDSAKPETKRSAAARGRKQRIGFGRAVSSPNKGSSKSSPSSLPAKSNLPQQQPLMATTQQLQQHKYPPLSSHGNYPMDGRYGPPYGMHPSMPGGFPGLDPNFAPPQGFNPSLYSSQGPDFHGSFPANFPDMNFDGANFAGQFDNSPQASFSDLSNAVGQFGPMSGPHNFSMTPNPNMPANQSMPSNPAMPSNPNLPSNPAMPSNPNMPSNPAMPSNPNMPSNPAMPSNPNIPTNPTLPSNPNMPSNPSIGSDQGISSSNVSSDPSIGADPSLASERNMTSDPNSDPNISSSNSVSNPRLNSNPNMSADMNVNSNLNSNPNMESNTAMDGRQSIGSNNHVSSNPNMGSSSGSDAQSGLRGNPLSNSSSFHGLPSGAPGGFGSFPGAPGDLLAPFGQGDAYSGSMNNPNGFKAEMGSTGPPGMFGQDIGGAYGLDSFNPATGGAFGGMGGMPPFGNVPVSMPTSMHMDRSADRHVNMMTRPGISLPDAYPRQPGTFEMKPIIPAKQEALSLSSSRPDKKTETKPASVKSENSLSTPGDGEVNASILSAAPPASNASSGGSATPDVKAIGEASPSLPPGCSVDPSETVKPSPDEAPGSVDFAMLEDEDSAFPDLSDQNDDIKKPDELSEKNIQLENATPDGIGDLENKVEDNAKRIPTILPLVSTKPLPGDRPIEERIMEPLIEKKEQQLSFEWAAEAMTPYEIGLLEHGGKLMLLFSLIGEAMRQGDKLLIFSQSLFTLDLIEAFLSRTYVPNLVEPWERNRSYFRLDGSTSSSEREKLINMFNAPSNNSIHLFLLSTRAGCLGINLIGANRVIIFDASWNPCHDSQAVCRVYRYGQKKPSFIYRLVTDNTMEQKIYERQINKQGMSDRVVDELQPQNNFTRKQVDSLLDYEDKDVPSLDENFEDESEDQVLNCVVKKHHKWLTKFPFKHESLLLDRKDQQLTRSEKRLAKQGYEREKKMNNTYNRPSYASFYPANPHETIRVSTTSGQTKTIPIIHIRPMAKTPIPHRPGMAGFPGANQMGNLLKPGVTVHQVKTSTDINIPGSNTSTPSGSSVVNKIPAGETVLVIKTPKGVYIRTKTGKIFAVRSSKEREGELLPGSIDLLAAQGGAPGSVKMPALTRGGSTLPATSSATESIETMETMESLIGTCAASTSPTCTTTTSTTSSGSPVLTNHKGLTLNTRTKIITSTNRGGRVVLSPSTAVPKLRPINPKGTKPLSRNTATSTPVSSATKTLTAVVAPTTSSVTSKVFDGEENEDKREVGEARKTEMAAVAPMQTPVAPVQPSVQTSSSPDTHGMSSDDKNPLTDSNHFLAISSSSDVSPYQSSGLRPVSMSGGYMARPTGFSDFPPAYGTYPGSFNPSGYGSAYAGWPPTQTASALSGMPPFTSASTSSASSQSATTSTGGSSTPMQTLEQFVTETATPNSTAPMFTPPPPASSLPPLYQANRMAHAYPYPGAFSSYDQFPSYEGMYHQGMSPYSYRQDLLGEMSEFASPSGSDALTGGKSPMLPPHQNPYMAQYPPGPMITPGQWMASPRGMGPAHPSYMPPGSYPY